MVTNSWWIKTDYWVQTVLGICILVCAASIVGLMGTFILLIPLGAWQVISGLIAALRNDRIQQIYLVVIVIHLSLWFSSYTINAGQYLIIPLIIAAIIIGIWKYTVIRADYISLKIISVPETDLLDA
jgi:hypothetical protein